MFTSGKDRLIVERLTWKSGIARGLHGRRLFVHKVISNSDVVRNSAFGKLNVGQLKVECPPNLSAKRLRRHGSQCCRQLYRLDLVANILYLNRLPLRDVKSLPIRNAGGRRNQVDGPFVLIKSTCVSVG